MRHNDVVDSILTYKTLAKEKGGELKKWRSNFHNITKKCQEMLRKMLINMR
jgi:predicted transcriptional regulator